MDGLEDGRSISIDPCTVRYLAGVVWVYQDSEILIQGLVFDSTPLPTLDPSFLLSFLARYNIHFAMFHIYMSLERSSTLCVSLSKISA